MSEESDLGKYFKQIGRKLEEYAENAYLTILLFVFLTNVIEGDVKANFSLCKP
jgi:hypothetical protein